MTQYYFETLLLHPQPKRLESLTSYLTRLANCNGIRSIAALAALIFEPEPPGGIRGMRRDHPPQSLGSLQTLAVCSEAALLQTTFVHLIRKFDLSISLRQPVSFLLSSLARTLRYCPICLVDYSFYSLAWRF